jgi:Flp pilus assembly protein TadB
MDLSSEIFVLVVACLIVGCIMLGFLIAALILLPRHDDRRLQMRPRDTITPNEGQTENGEPNSRDIMNSLRNGFAHIQRENLINFRITLITLAIAIMLASVAGLQVSLLSRVILYVAGMIVILAVLFSRRVS